jgi:hypothetical protein
MDKFGRTYRLAVDTQNVQFIASGTQLIVEPPFTIEFDITRNILSSANASSFRIYNLSPNTRNQIRKNISDYQDLRKINLKAGYIGSNLPVVFDGNITQAWSVREGTNFITQIESFDGGFAFANGLTATSFPEGTDQNTIIETLIASLPAVTPGIVGDFSGALSRGNAYSGSTPELLRELTGGGFFIDNGKAHALKNNECLAGELQVITAESGLLGTPVRENTILNFDMIFEPRLLIGQIIELQSSTDVNFNGLYKIISLKHRGMISETVCGDAVTSVGLWNGTKALLTVK